MDRRAARQLVEMTRRALHAEPSVAVVPARPVRRGWPLELALRLFGEVRLGESTTVVLLAGVRWREAPRGGAARRGRRPGAERPPRRCDALRERRAPFRRSPGAGCTRPRRRFAYPRS